MPTRWYHHQHARQRRAHRRIWRRIFIVPYVMPGFILAKVYGMTRDIDWAEVRGSSS
jgi:rhamnose utilization protein RhaD (predicted bifunctional aldolase and dehydrogenase)